MNGLQVDFGNLGKEIRKAAEHLQGNIYRKAAWNSFLPGSSQDYEVLPVRTRVRFYPPDCVRVMISSGVLTFRLLNDQRRSSNLSAESVCETLYSECLSVRRCNRPFVFMQQGGAV